MGVACEAILWLGRYEQAVISCERAKGSNGNDWMIDLLLASAYGQLGEVAKAGTAKAEVLRAVPGYSIGTHKARRYSANPEYVRLAEEHLYAGMRKAGFAEN